MKNSQTSKSAAIRYESELVAHFRDFVTEDPDLHWILATETLSPEGTRSDLLNLKFDGTNFSFRPYYALKPSLPWLENLPVHASSLRPLVVTPELSPRVLATCKEREIAAIDLNGRAWLRAPGLLVDRRALPGRSFSYELEPRNIFFGKSVRIVRCLLSDRDHIWTQSEIVPRVNASTGLVSRIVQHLVSQGFLEKLSAREYRLRDWKALLDEWAQADRLHTRTRTTAYAGFLGPAQELAPRVQQWAKAEKVPLAFTQWTAAWVRHPYTEPTVCSAYVARLPDAATLEQLGLRTVTEGGKLWFHVPEDEGVFSETQQRSNFTLVSDAQIYIDLQRLGLRGPEAASALLEWEGFCRP